MVDRRVEVDVVDDLDGQQHVHLVERVQQRRAARRRSSSSATRLAHRPAAAARHQHVERRAGGEVEVDAGGDEIDDVVTDAHADTRLLVARPEDAERQVLEREVRPLGNRRPRSLIAGHLIEFLPHVAEHSVNIGSSVMRSSWSACSS